MCLCELNDVSRSACVGGGTLITRNMKVRVCCI